MRILKFISHYAVSIQLFQFVVILILLTLVEEMMSKPIEKNKQFILTDFFYVDVNRMAPASNVLSKISMQKRCKQNSEPL